MLYHRVKFEPCKELRFDSRGFVAYTSKKKKKYGRDGKNLGQLEQSQKEGGLLNGGERGNDESHFLLLLFLKRACNKFSVIAEGGMLSSPSEFRGPVKTEPLLTESMGGGRKITRGICQASPMLCLFLCPSYERSKEQVGDG